MTRPPQPRIDLNHGYMRFIRRNQLDRDEFDKVHERRKSEIRERLAEQPAPTPTSTKYIPPHLRRPTTAPQKPSNIYVPPHLRQKRETPPGSVAASRSVSRSDSDSQEDEKQRIADDRIRSQVRRRIERTHATVDDICVSLANYSLKEAQRATQKNKEEEDLFILELTLQTGEKKLISVPRNTQAARLAKSLSREHSFDDSQCRNLRIFIEEQLEVRLEREQKSTGGSVSSSSSTTPDSSIPTSPCSTAYFSTASSTSDSSPF
ncbi:unnamed protein product [Caenorhabditis sp. 36 PRJEB53466]|nr:unnamed protein product [Caenorhabditis sp. 36 PRJEB53466]